MSTLLSDQQQQRTPITAMLADFIATSRFENVPTEATQRAKNSFLDAVGVALAGSSESGPEILAHFIRESGGSPVASIIGHGFKTTAQYAAWVNGTSADVLGWADFSVTQMNHPSASICPAVLALGEQLGASGKQILHAYILGVEISNKIAQGVKPQFHKKGWHALGVCNTFGAVAAAAKLLNLDTMQIANALGIAGAEASGIKASMLTMTKSYVAGSSARDGISCAILAKMGFTGPTDVIEARDGFLQTFGDGADGTGILEHLGDPFEFVAPGLTLKSYPSCTHTHTGIWAALDLKREHRICPDDIESVVCSVAPAVYDFLTWTSPRNRTEARFSMQFCVATALIEGRVDLSNFTDKKVTAPEMVKLMKKIRMIVSPELAKLGYNPAVAPSGCTVTIVLKSGKTFSQRVDKGPWEPETPPSLEDLVQKYRSCSSVPLNSDQIDESLAILEKLEEADSVCRLMEIVRG